MKHKRLSLTTLLTLLIGWCVCPQLRAYDIEVNGIYYNLSGTNATVTYPTASAPTADGQNTYTGDIVIPSTIESGGTTYTVTTIGANAFFRSTITSVEIPNTVTEIQKEAFARTSLTTATIPDNVTTLRNDAFAYNGKLATVTVGAGVTTLNQGVFFSSTIKNVYFRGTTPPSSIAGYMFSYNPTIHVYATSLLTYQSSALANYTKSLVGDLQKDYTYEELQQCISQFKSLSVKSGTAPGYYTPESVNTYENAITSAEAISSSEETSVINQAVNAISSAYTNLQYIPVTEGYYALICDHSKIAANGKSEKAMYINADKNTVCWGTYEENNIKYIFHITKNGKGWNMQNLKNSLYVNGSTGFCAVFNAAEEPTSVTYFNFYAGTGSCYIKNVLDSQSDQGLWTMCPQGNAEGTADGPGNVFAYNGETIRNKAHDEWTWQLRPIDEENEAIKTYIAQLELENLLKTKETLTASDDPNCYNEIEVKKYNDAFNKALEVALDGTAEEKQAAATTIKNIKSQLTPNPITEGYYYITSAGYYQNSNDDIYNYEDKNALYNNAGIVKWKAFDKTDMSQVYRLIKGSDGWYVYNPSTKTYINKGKGSYSCDVTTTTSATTTQKFTPMADGNGKYAMYSDRYAYALGASHYGSSVSSGNLNIWGTTAEARNYGMNQWYLHKIEDEDILSIVLPDLIAEAKSAIKTYKTSTQDGDYYAGTDANHGLKSHYFVDGTERTSQKGYECTQEQIDNLQLAIKDAETVAAMPDASQDEIQNAYENLKATKAVCDKKWAPLVDGVYFIINGFADDAPNAAQALKYGENGRIVYKRPLITSEPKQMFEVKVTSWTTDADGDKIPASAQIKNIASGKYLGGVSDGHNVFSNTPVEITWPVANTQGATKQGHRFQLQTPTGELFNGQNNQAGCEVTTSGLYDWHRSWMFRPADKYYEEYLQNKEFNDYKNSVLTVLATPTAKQDADLGSNSWIDGTERTAVAGVETTQERIDALQAAWDAYEADRTPENKEDVEAAMATVEQRWEPIEDGVYFLIPRYGDDQTNNNTQAMTYSGNAAWKKPLNMTDPNFMFKVTVKSTIDDATLGHVPQTLTIQNVATGKYLGALNGSAWEYQDEQVVWSFTTFVGSDFFSDTKHAHCFGLNIDGKFITYGNNTAGTALTTATSGAWAWMRAWMFRPADKYYEEYIKDKEKNDILNPALASINSAITPANHHDNTNGRSFLLGNEKTSIDGLATSQEAIDALKKAYDIVKAGFDSGKSVADLADEIADLNAKKAVVDAKDNPLTTGIYFLIAEYADDTNNVPGGYALTYGKDLQKRELAYKRPYNKSNPLQVFVVERNEEQNLVFIKSIVSGKYLSKLNNGKWEFTTEAIPLNIVSGADYYWYWGAEKTRAARSCSFILTDANGNGVKCSTNTDNQLENVADVKISTPAWTVSWAFRPANMQDLSQLRSYTHDESVVLTSPTDLDAESYKAMKVAIIEQQFKATLVDLTGAKVNNLTPDEIRLTECSTVSANTIYKLPADYPTAAPNFMIGDKVPNLVLTDKANYNKTLEFDADKATYQKTGLDGKGWYSAILPYDITVPEGVTVLTNAQVKDQSIMFDEVKAGGTIEANSPFIYKTADQSVTFQTDDVTVEKAVPNTNGVLRGTYTLIDKGEATGKLILNSDGSAFATATENATIPALRAYIESSAGSGMFTITINDELTGVATSDALNGNAAPVDVYTIDGQLLRSQVDPLTALQGLPKGIYLVNGKKIKK